MGGRFRDGDAKRKAQIGKTYPKENDMVKKLTRSARTFRSVLRESQGTVWSVPMLVRRHIVFCG